MRSIYTLFILSFATPLLHAQEIKTIKLKQQHIAYEPKNYYISSVADDRSDTADIGMVHVGLANREVAINLKGGPAAAINEFIQNNVSQDRQKEPINIHITKLNVSEKNMRVKEQADVDFAICFYKGDTKLTEYSGNAYAQSGIDVTGYVERLIRQSIERSLSDFDKWWGENKRLFDTQSSQSTQSSQAHVEVTIIINHETLKDTDQINYDRNRPISREDFKGEPDDLSIGAAATYSGIAMKYSFEKGADKVKLNITITASFDKTKSWWKTKINPEATRAHEQMHFDITAITTCELAEKIKNAILTPDDYQEQIEALHKEAMKQLQLMQNKYDKETKHGSLKNEQERWNKMIKEKVTQMNCY